MLVPKYGPAAAGTPQNGAEKSPEQGLFGSYPREVIQFPTIHTGVWAGRDIVSHGTVIRSNTFSAALAPPEDLPFSQSWTRNGRRYPRPPSPRDRAGPGRARSESRLRRVPCAPRGRGWRRASP